MTAVKNLVQCMKAWRHRDAAAKLSSVPADTAKRKASVFVKGVKVVLRG